MTKRKIVLFLFHMQKMVIFKTIIENENKGNVREGWNYIRKCIVIYGIAMVMYNLHSHDITHSRENI